MATEAQIAANRNNAQASTGPTTAAGKARSSRNALSSGLFSRGDFVLPDEQAQYAEFCAGFQAHLEPDGPIEQTFAAEIIHAAWRMRRCSAVAAGLTGSLDPMVDPAAAQTQQAVDRARNDAHRAFQRSLSELRRLQTERQFRTESFPDDFDPATLGIASFKDMAPALMIDTQRQMLLQKLRPNPEPKPLFTIPTQSGIGQTPRNSPCTCGSGLKFKRCCGKGAPAVLNLAA
jgi:SEC-C motif-containing protein